ncbi:MAG: hypothetical protein A2020_06790 [Lentisphaerae bacterium GWF2_45_14]|nr:MAG: hypothetical protein A2020_06790 [Lentisphaerae bacterium GWF2_45_14]
MSALAEAGAKLYIASRGVEALEKVAAEEQKRGFDVTALPLNLEEDKSLEELHERIISEKGKSQIHKTLQPERLSPGASPDAGR